MLRKLLALIFPAKAVEPPDGFRRIASLPLSNRRRQIDFKVVDWKPVPAGEFEYGCLFVWLEIDRKKTAFFLTKREAWYLDTEAHSRLTHLRIVRNRGRRYALPINPKWECGVGRLPPPPASFPRLFTG